jgi:hypothetical protein
MRDESGLDPPGLPCNCAADAETTRQERAMTNTVAAWMAGLILLASALDLLLNSGQVIFFLAQKLVALIEWMAFWR